LHPNGFHLDKGEVKRIPGECEVCALATVATPSRRVVAAT